MLVSNMGRLAITWHCRWFSVPGSGWCVVGTRLVPGTVSQRPGWTGWEVGKCRRGSADQQQEGTRGSAPAPRCLSLGQPACRPARTLLPTKTDLLFSQKITKWQNSVATWCYKTHSRARLSLGQTNPGA